MAGSVEEQLREARQAAAAAETRRDWETAGHLRYQVIPALERQRAVAAPVLPGTREFFRGLGEGLALAARLVIAVIILAIVFAGVIGAVIMGTLFPRRKK